MPDPFAYLNLHVPKLDTPVATSFKTGTRHVQKWLKGLPLADLGATTKLIYRGLREMNTLAFKSSDRFEALELIRPLLHDVVDGLRKHYLGKDLPLDEKSANVLELCVEMFHELSLGYKIIIQFASIGEDKVNKKILATSLQRAIRYLSQIHIETYLVYATERPGVWLQLHQLYQFAVRAKMHNVAVSDNKLELVEQASAADSYKQILLIAAVDPYHMKLGEVTELYRAMENWAPSADLVSSDTEIQNNSVFLVRVETDYPPTHIGYKLKRGKYDLILRTDRLADTIDAEIKSPHKKSLFRRTKKNPPVSAPVLEQVILALGVVPKRRFNRTRTGSRVAAIAGLSQIFALLIHEEQRKGLTSADERSHFAAKEKRRKADPNDVWDFILPGSRPSQGREAYLSLDPVKFGVSNENYNPQDWQLQNISAGGYCVLSDRKQKTRAHVGELLAIREMNTDASLWQVGVVRWMKQVDIPGVSLGVQILYPGGNPVNTVTTFANGKKTNPAKSLLLPEIRPLNQPITLVTPCLHYEVGKEVKVRTGKRGATVVLTKLIQTTGSFSQFEFVVIENAENLPVTIIGSERKFEDLWSSI